MTTLLCNDCGTLFEVPLFIPNGGEYGGISTKDQVSPCCKSTFTEHAAQVTFSINENEYYALVELAQMQLRNSLDLIKTHMYSPMTEIEIKSQLKQQAISAGLNYGDWWIDFEKDLHI